MKVNIKKVIMIVVLASIFTTYSYGAKKGGGKAKKFKLPDSISYDISEDKEYRNRFKELKKQQGYYNEQLSKLNTQSKKKSTTKSLSKKNNQSVAMKKKQLATVQNKIDGIYEKKLSVIEKKLLKLSINYAEEGKRMKMTDSHERILKRRNKIVAEAQAIVSQFKAEYIDIEPPSKNLIKKHSWLSVFVKDKTDSKK